MRDARVQAFLDLIAWSEATSTSRITRNNGYDIIVTGLNGPALFTDYSDHPFARGRKPVIWHTNPLKTSTASGRYQLELRWWLAYRKTLNLPDFSPASQDAVALQQIKEQHAMAALLADDPQEAIMDCGNIWASFPNNNYGQRQRTMTELAAQYQKLLQKIRAA